MTLFKSTPHEQCTKDSIQNIRHELHFHRVDHPRRLDFILNFLLILFPQTQNICLVCCSMSSEFPFEIRDSFKRDVKFPQRCWTSVTSTVTDLIKSMLKHHPKERIDLNMILSHPWLKVGLSITTAMINGNG